MTHYTIFDSLNRNRRVATYETRLVYTTLKKRPMVKTKKNIKLTLSCTFTDSYRFQKSMMTQVPFYLLIRNATRNKIFNYSYRLLIDRYQ